MKLLFLFLFLLLVSCSEYPYCTHPRNYKRNFNYNDYCITETEKNEVAQETKKRMEVRTEVMQENKVEHCANGYGYKDCPVSMRYTGYN